jgi:Terminase large subunit, T4likevirus-type, N-terminal/Terminase RNaseH-like domain
MPALNTQQAKFIQLPHKFRAYVGGYGSGKTWAGSSAMCARFWKHPGINQGYFAPTYPHIRDIFFPTIEEVAYGLDLRTETMEANKEVHFYSGRKYRGTTICRSMERPQTIVGFKIGHSLIDELDTLDPKKAQQAWRKIIARLRWQDAPNGADVTTTPEGFRETHRLFVAEIANNPTLANLYGMVQASTRANAKNLPDGYIQSLLDTYPAELIDAYIDGQFCNLTTGTVYRNYNRLRCESLETIRDDEPLFIGLDFNVGKMAASIYVQRPNGWHGVSELHDVFDTPAMVKIIQERWSAHRIIVYPDASGGSRKTVDASRSDIAILSQAGFEVRAKSINPPVRDRLLSVNKQLEVGKLWINYRQCPTIARNLEQQAYDDNGEPDKKSGFDHQNDATGYPIAYEFPIIRGVQTAQILGL